MANPCAVIELTVRCKGLRSADVLSKSDPMVVAYELHGDGGKETEIGRTECVSNDHAPKFKKTISFEYFFERVQKIRFLVIDVDNKSEEKKPVNLKKSAHIGEVTLSPSQVLANKNPVFPLHDKSGKVIKGCEIRISGRNLNKKEELHISFSATNLDKKDLMGKSDPYLIIYRLSQSTSEKTKVCQTEVIKNTLNPNWSQQNIYVGNLTDYNAPEPYETPVLIECWDWDKISDSDFIGAATVPLRELLQQGGQITLLNPKKAKKGKDMASGVIQITSANVSSKQSFIDYLRAGAEISLAVAIDFTGSNGHPMDPASLHHIAPSGAWNPYMRAIYCVGNVLAPYDSDQMFALYGFGASFPNSTSAVHDFHVNFNPEDPRVYGVEGIVNAYRNCISQIALSGPTNFVPIIRKFSKFVATEKKQMSYYILLIITDGEITDMNATRDAIAKSAELPISIIIVGVGGADFAAMVELDGDVKPLCDSTGCKVLRDNVNFVPFRDYDGDDGQRLAEAVLHEIPDQFLKYMDLHNIFPVYSSPVFSPTSEPVEIS